MQYKGKLQGWEEAVAIEDAIDTLLATALSNYSGPMNSFGTLLMDLNRPTDGAANNSCKTLETHARPPQKLFMEIGAKAAPEATGDPGWWPSNAFKRNFLALWKKCLIVIVLRSASRTGNF